MTPKPRKGTSKGEKSVITATPKSREGGGVSTQKIRGIIGRPKSKERLGKGGGGGAELFLVGEQNLPGTSISGKQNTKRGEREMGPIKEVV